jgi:hypothetical protein
MHTPVPWSVPAPYPSSDSEKAATLSFDIAYPLNFKLEAVF